MHEQVAARLSHELKRRRAAAARENRPLETMSPDELDDVYTQAELEEQRAHRDEQRIARMRAEIEAGRYPHSEAIEGTVNCLGDLLLGAHR